MVTVTVNAYYILHIIPELYLKIDSLQNCEEESWCKHDQRLVWLKIADKERVRSFTKRVVRKLSKFMTLVSFNIICYLSESHITWSKAGIAFFSERVLMSSIYIYISQWERSEWSTKLSMITMFEYHYLYHLILVNLDNGWLRGPWPWKWNCDRLQLSQWMYGVQSSWKYNLV